MARTFQDFAKQMKELAEFLPVRVNEIKITTASTIHNHLINNTPVDTGEAMSNWIIKANEAPTETRPPFVPSKRGYVAKHGTFKDFIHQVPPEVTRSANLVPAKEQADKELATINPGDSIHVTNNVAHIKPLDQGNNGRPALNFADRAIMLARDTVKRAKLFS
jgi:hypothetical protein